ncbi:Cardiolipin synthase A [Enhygromyxa salina]|uniref:Cardiolipin synthase A n=1 Tax=Enhygromyxa salina TaxID=215803 RepID=A0A2S9XYC7_9BACT|nr:DISARM system phospholipase D-like protein DrmC [Enhygromyxa salina]PRP97856.1 Cardiolipin synthase A [Enhygromyxa salina]
MSGGLTAVSNASLERLRTGLEIGRLRAPLTRSELVAFGVREQLDALTAALGGHSREACLSIVDAVLAEREKLERPAPELVWTGPEGSNPTARDTAVVLRTLFEGAQDRIVLAGYSFYNAPAVLGPLYTSMKRRGVKATFFVQVDQLEHAVADPDAYGQAELQEFMDKNWKFGAPYPEAYCDRRALRPGPPWSSLHSKCVAVDGQRAFVSSANWTRRAQERNFETGVLLHDSTFAKHLERQWLGLIAANLVLRWSPQP